MSVELREVRDFLAAHDPWDELPAALLDELPRQLQTRYFRRGTSIVALNSSNDDVYILRSGAIDITDAGGNLVERTEPGGTVGVWSTLNKLPSIFGLTAIADSLVLVMPGAVFRRLLDDHAVLAEHFSGTSQRRMAAAVATVSSSSSGNEILRSRVSDMLGGPPISAPSTVTIREAAEVMANHRVSALLIIDAGRLIGIVTDRDLRSKVVATGRDINEPISAIMTPNPITVSPRARAFEVLLAMTSRSVHHMPVVDDGKPVGLVSSGDLMRLERAHPIHVTADLMRQKTVDGVAEVAHRLPAMVAQFITQDATASEIGRILTAVYDTITTRLITFAMDELGPAPAPWCWLVLGSAGRRELSLASDQDHAIMVSDQIGDQSLEWYQELAKRVTSGLEKSGYPLCHGEVMATNPKWLASQTQWRRYFAKWMNEPDSMSVMYTQIFFDARPVFGDSTVFESVHNSVLSSAPAAQRFLGHLATQAVLRQPPLGFFKGFVLEKEGAHAEQLDLKSGGIHCIVEMARVYALAGGKSEISTLGRLGSAVESGRISQQTCDELTDAFEFISHVRLRQQARDVQAGRPLTNHVSPKELSTFEQRHLREAFTLIRQAQKGLDYVFQTHLMK